MSYGVHLGVVGAGYEHVDGRGRYGEGGVVPSECYAVTYFVEVGSGCCVWD